MHTVIKIVGSDAWYHRSLRIIKISNSGCAVKIRENHTKVGQLFMQAYAKIAQDAATMDPPIDRPDGTMFGTAGPNSRALDAARDKSG